MSITYTKVSNMWNTGWSKYVQHIFLQIWICNKKHKEILEIKHYPIQSPNFPISKIY